MRTIVALAAALAIPVAAAAATLHPHTITAWNAYVAATEARITRELAASKGFLASDFSHDAAKARDSVRRGEVVIAQLSTMGANGAGIDVPDGLISHWRGSIFLPGVTLETLLNRLQHPNERGPHQQDVLALRVLAREPDRLKLFIKMTRKKVVTVTYNSEHVLAYRRHGPSRASSRSVSTKIAELEDAGTSTEREKPQGEDRGFMWRLNSYWRYEQIEGGVIVELESVTLSRTIPLGMAVLVQPIVNRIARESIARTLENMKRTYAPSLLARSG
jgi:hypothetical protein